MWGAGAGMGWWMLFGTLLWFAFLGTLIYLFVALIGDRRHAPFERRDDPIEIAKRRYASGQITSDEFERIRRELAA